MNNITVIELKALAKYPGIKGFCKLRKAELIHKLEVHPDVNEQVLMPELKIPRNATRSVNTSAILHQLILDNNTPVLKPTPQFIAKSVQKIKDSWIWLLDYIPPKLKVVDEALESFKNQIRKLYNKRDTSFELKVLKSALKKFAIQYRIDGKDWIDPELFLVNAKQSMTNLLIDKRQSKVKIYSFVYDGEDGSKKW